MAPNTSTKYDLEKFDGSNDFSLWRMKMHAILIQQGLLKALKGKQGLPDTMSADEKENMLERAHSALLLCLADNMLRKAEALTMLGLKIIEDRGLSQRPELKWYYCHNEGHYRKDCPERKGKKKDNSKTADTGVVEDNSDGADVLSVTISSSDEGWIIDTGYSYHICPNRDLFATYRSFDGGKVLMENDVACKVVGISSIQIRMHDGIVRTLTDVRDVPELRKNLISLGTLNSNGCSYRAAGGVMRIMKGALVVIHGFFFAMKEVSLLDQGDQGRQSIYQLEQEIALLSQFEHENIVQYFGTDKDDAKLYIFLELVTKGSLLSLYRKYTLRDSQVSAYTRQILHGLKYLHDRNVAFEEASIYALRYNPSERLSLYALLDLHLQAAGRFLMYALHELNLDIKCANILVDANGSVKLADFGLAKATKLNDVKSCKGTAFWMAPEGDGVGGATTGNGKGRAVLKPMSCGKWSEEEETAKSDHEELTVDEKYSLKQNAPDQFDVYKPPLKAKACSFLMPFLLKG
ncbi:hypothetical protein RJ639_020933 [Escallonia herrerae]|uniref:Protein kinase domain-containing protein n=1 Tax=Escallonia herrerae TaxID=1293975 RepID=A0AA89AI87_9ASTE|nr:hypothetical protein RJ639_020933 [Escallonia herrerae]